MRFAQAVPPVGYQSLVGMQRMGTLRIEGDIVAWGRNLIFLEQVFAAVRPDAPPETIAPAGSPEIEPAVGRYLRMDFNGKPHRIYFEEAGQGIPLICLHTAGADGRQYRALLNDAGITSRFRVIVFDLPWHGKSSPPRGFEREAYRLTTELYVDTVMAFCAEPVVGATTGCVAALPGYFGRVREICDRHGALLILDEVMCGMGRTGTLHAWEQEGVSPDIQMVAKGLGGGYQPIGGILIGRRVVDGLRAGSGGFMHGQTYQAHPVACAAALAVQKVIAEDGLLANVRAMGEALSNGLTQRLGNHRHVGDIRGRGLFWAIELVADRGSKAVFDPGLKLHERVAQAAYERGLAIYPMGGTIDGVRGNHVIISPPYIATAGDIGAIVDRLGDAVDAVCLGVGFGSA